jgi:hypothetical protein
MTADLFRCHERRCTPHGWVGGDRLLVGGTKARLLGSYFVPSHTYWRLRVVGNGVVVRSGL